MKKMTTFVCVAAITASLLAGCGGKQTETTAAAESTAASTEAAVSTETAAESAEGTDADKEAADKVAALIDAIYVQERNDSTDEQCKEAKAAWDALTDAQKAMVEGENADPDYFGRDTGDASKDDPRNQDDIGENELLVVSFGTSFNDSRVKDIKGIEDALQEANPDWSVRRAFTAQIIINHVEARDGECIDPTFFRWAGARFTVMRLTGKAKPQFLMAERTRSRASVTAASGRPTMVKAGRPPDRSNSAVTG